jgi:hypothetical protein
MTRQTVDELHPEGTRIDERVEQSMRESSDTLRQSWGVEYEIPQETNGWIYYGDMGALATCANWGNQWPDPQSVVGVIINSTHPQDETPICADVHHVSDLDEKVESKTRIDRFEGQPYRTPLYVRRRIFWEAVERAIEWMENNSPSAVCRC